jgi:iron complex transport system substrate-binding protein
MTASPRIASLIASATEIVCALGFEDGLVGRSHECDHPESVWRLPVLTAPRLEVSRPSCEIDAAVRSLLERALSVYSVDAALLRDLRPDVVATQDLCRVCAVSLRDVEAALAAWTGARPRVVSCHPRAFADVWDDVGRIAEALGAPERGRALVASLRSRAAAIAERAAAIAERPSGAAGGDPRPRVACIEWIDPLMAAGNWVPELVAMAGGQNLFGEPGRHSPGMEWRDLVRADPDVIVVLPCGYDIATSRREMPALTSRPEWPGLRAVRAGRVVLADGNRYFNRPGPRLVESLEILAEVLEPEAFAFGHEGRGWERLDPVRR